MSVTINGKTLASLGVTPRELTGWLDGPALLHATTAIPNVVGVYAATATTTAARELRLTVVASLSALTDRAAKLATLKDAVAGLVTLRFDDTPGRIVRAIAGPMTSASIAPQLAMTATASSLIVTIPFIALDGASYDDEARVYALSTTPTQIELGTLPAPGILQWSGAWTAGTARTLTYRALNGIAYGSLTFTPPTGASLSASEYLEIDLGRQYVTKVDSTGGRTNAYSWKSAGTWFVPDSIDADRTAPRWPTLDISAGAAIWLTRRAWSL